MAAPDRNRTKPGDPLYEKTRAKIQSSQLVNRLNKNALGNLIDTVTKKPIEMTTGQIRSAEILLNKSLPSLQATELSNPDGTLQPILNITHEKGK